MSLRKQVLNSILWSAVMKYSSMIVVLAVTMVMARMLTPKDFGIVAIAMVVIAFLSIFSQMGIGPAIIQKKELTQEDLSNIFSFSVYLGIALSIILFFASWYIAIYFQSEILKPICQLLCIDIFFVTINMVPTALMSKHKRFKEMAIRSLIINLLSAFLSIIAVLLGFGIYSLIVNPIMIAIGMFIFNFHYYPLKFNLRFSFSPLKRIASYSAYQFAFQFVGFFSSNLDKLIIGRFVLQESLGYYDKAHSLTKYPISILASVISPVLHPFLSDYQTNITKIKDSHNLMTKILSSISIPMAVIIWFCGPELIILFYGSQWKDSIMTFQIFALTIPVSLLLTTSSAYWQSTNSTKLLFWTGLINSGIVIIGYIITASFFGSIEMIAWGFFVSCVIVFIVTYTVMYYKVFHDSFLSMIKLLFNPLVNALLLMFFYLFVDIININQYFISLIIKVLIGLLITIFFLQVTGRFDIKKVVTSKKITL